MKGTRSEDERPDVLRRTSSAPEGAVPLDLVLPRSVEAPGLARQALRHWIEARSFSDELIDDAVLLVSESVTNAVVHASSAPRLLVTIREGRLRVEVHDTSQAPPVPRAPSTAVGGQGLRILAGVADAWGWEMTSAGKVVWTEQRLEGPRQEGQPTISSR